MAGFLLDDGEKARFGQWLTMRIETYQGMIRQLERLPSVVKDELVKREKREMAACVIVLSMITSGESVSIGKAEDDHECSKEHP